MAGLAIDLKQGSGRSRGPAWRPECAQAIEFYGVFTLLPGSRQPKNCLKTATGKIMSMQ
ncbi:MAG TPA: hypothetical protein VF396_07020 [Bradyrhizobium sp.]